MSDIKIQPSATGSGTVTITAPTTNTARVITLPDSAGTLLDENSSVPAANLTGTVADARFPATLPAASGVNLTALPAGNLTGTVADARISALTASKLTGALPAISGASLTGVGKVVNTFTIGSSGGSVTVSATSSYQSIGCSGSISVTAGNKLLIQLNSGVYGASGKHYSFQVYFNGTAVVNPAWGSGILHGDSTVTGWDNHTNIYQTTVSSTGTYTIEAKANCNTGSIQFQRDGTTGSGWGYDCAKMIVWEVKP